MTTFERSRADRSRALMLGVGSALVARALILLAPLVTIPVTLAYLGPEIFGLWMVASSFTAMAAFADLGLGSGLLTKLSPLIAKDEVSAARRLISSAYFVLTIVSASVLLLIGAAALLAHEWLLVPFPSGETDLSADVLIAVLALCFAAFALTIPLSLVQRVQYAYQQAWASNAWQVAGAIATVAAVYTAVTMDVGAIATIAAAVFAAPALMALNTVLYFTLQHPELAPAARLAERASALPLLTLGSRFLSLSIITSLALNVDNLIVARGAGIAAVSDYSIATRLFSILSIAITFVALPLWPANGEAIARGDKVWVTRTTKLISLSSGLVVGFGAAVLIVSRDWITLLWLGPNHSIPLDLAISLGIWGVALAVTSPLFSVQNSIGVLKFQLIGWAIFLALSVPLKVLFVDLLGEAGVPIAGALTYILVVFPAALLGYRSAVNGIVRPQS